MYTGLVLIPTIQCCVLACLSWVFFWRQICKLPVATNRSIEPKGVELGTVPED